MGSLHSTTRATSQTEVNLVQAIINEATLLIVKYTNIIQVLESQKSAELIQKKAAAAISNILIITPYATPSEGEGLTGKELGDYIDAPSGSEKVSYVAKYDIKQLHDVMKQLGDATKYQATQHSKSEGEAFGEAIVYTIYSGVKLDNQSEGGFSIKVDEVIGKRGGEAGEGFANILQKTVKQVNQLVRTGKTDVLGNIFLESGADPKISGLDAVVEQAAKISGWDDKVLTSEDIHSALKVFQEAKKNVKAVHDAFKAVSDYIEERLL